MASRPPRLLELDAARGLAIVLVVIGHIISKGEVPADNNWFLMVMNMIYQFHMPFFMVLTGISFALSVPAFASWAEVGSYSLRRVKPLLVPFMVIGLVVVIGKDIAANFLDVSNPPGSFGSSVLKLLYDPNESAARFLWLIYVLAIYLIVIPPLFYLFGRRAMLLLVIGAGLQFFHWPETFALRALAEHLPFFALGMVLWIYRPLWTPIPLWLWSLSSILFGWLLYWSNYHTVPRWLTGACSVLPLIGLSQRIPAGLQSFWGYLGRNSLSIYLFNVPVMGLVKGVMFLVVDWNGYNFLFYFPILVAAGMGIPLAIKAACTKWLPPVSKFI